MFVLILVLVIGDVVEALSIKFSLYCLYLMRQLLPLAFVDVIATVLGFELIL